MGLIPEYKDDNGGNLSGIQNVEEAVTAASERKNVELAVTHLGQIRIDIDIEDEPIYYENVPENIEE